MTGEPSVPPARAGSDAALSILVALVLGPIALLSGSGSSLRAQTWIEIALLLLATVVAGALVTRGPLAGVRGDAAGTASFWLFAALAALTAASIGWSVAPDQSWLEAARTLSYLCAFGSALGLARLAPSRTAALVGGVALLATGIGAWAVIVKVFNLDIDGQPGYGRLLVPFSYWNATGLMAGIGLPPVVWAAASPRHPRAVRGVAVAAVTLLITIVVLSYSRSALAAAVIGCAVAIPFSARRLHALVMLALGGAGAAAVCAWALGDHALTSDRVSTAARNASGHTFGLVLLAALLAVALAGSFAATLGDRTTLSAAARRRIDRGLLTLVALVPVAALIALAVSSRGLTGEVSHIWSTLTSTKATVGDAPGRLADLANTRPRYWHQGLSVAEHHLLAGAGAGAFGVAQTRYPTAKLTVNDVGHAHSYVIETFADLGTIGLVLTTLLLLAWAAAAGRAIRSAPAERRGALLALLGAVVAFGVSSSVDWTWFFPGVAIPALLGAGWLAGSAPPARAAPAGVSRRPLGARPGAILGLTALAAVAVAAAWAIWQPLRSADADAAAISAMGQGRAGAALTDARAAADANPFSLQPLYWQSAFLEALGRPAAARAALVKATTIQPENPLPWTWLGEFALHQHEPRLALRALRRAAALDITNAQLPGEIGAARAQLQAH